MKYSTRQFPNRVGRAGLYSLIALCLAVVGAIAWILIARNNLPEPKTPLTSSKEDSVSSEYDKPSSSYNEPTEPTPTESATNEVSDVPYSQEVQEDAPSTPTEPQQAFQLPLNGDILKKFSSTELQPSATYGDLRLHEGVDIAAKSGANICAAGFGTVTTIEEHAALGKTVVIDHRDGLILRYSGLDSITVKSGDSVEPGQVLGTVGVVPAECADKPHLHLEAQKNGEAISPFEALGF